MKKNNAHGHLITKDTVPDDYPKTRTNFISEKIILKAPFEWIAFGVSRFISSKRLPEMLNLYKLNLREQAKRYIEEMNKANIKRTIILMMDLSQSSFGDFPEWSYPYQLEVMFEIAEEFGGRFYVFPMVDPRRESINDLIVWSFKNSKYVKGIKIYPALGYHPDPETEYNISYHNSVLQEILYTVADNKACIISHCSKGGAYSDKTMRSKEERNWLSHPLRWKNVLQNYSEKNFSDIKICLAHFGGDLHECIINQDGIIKCKKDNYAKEIIFMMENYPNLWTDIAYNDKLITEETEYRWATNFWNLSDYVYKRMLFGTDWIMIRHQWTEEEYCNLFEKNLLKYVPSYRYQVCKEILEDIFYRNFFEFLGIKEIG